MTRVLIVEDNDNMRRGLCDMLRADGYEPVGAADGAEGLARAQDTAPDVIVLDLMLPGGDGGQILRALRSARNNVPVLVLTAKSDEDEKVRLLKMGADDYVTKPFGRRELGARIAALMRRAHATPAGPPPPPLVFGDVTIDQVSRIVSRAGASVPLAPKEYNLLVALARRVGTVITRAELLREVWGYEPDVISRTVDLHILELRRRLERDPAQPELIMTVRKVGYRMTAPPPAR